jgi:hypothetical protein
MEKREEKKITIFTNTNCITDILPVVKGPRNKINGKRKAHKNRQF